MCPSYIQDARFLKVKEIGLEGVECINLAQDRDTWQAVVKAAVTNRVN